MTHDDRDTTVIDQLFLELSKFTKATTEKERELTDVNRWLRKLASCSKGNGLTWIPASERKPTHIYSVVLWIVGGYLHYDEDYMDVGSYFPEEGVWKVSGGDKDHVVAVSHWLDPPRLDGTGESENAEAETPKPMDAKDDLVNRLREQSYLWHPFCHTAEMQAMIGLLREAAEEIERLRAPAESFQRIMTMLDGHIEAHEAEDRGSVDSQTDAYIEVYQRKQFEIERLQTQLKAILEHCQLGWNNYIFSSIQSLWWRDWWREMAKLIEWTKDTDSQKGGE